MLSQRLVVLRNLVALRQIRIKIILARKDRSLIDAAIQSQSGQSSELDRLPIQNRQSPRHPQAHRTNIGIRRSPKARGAGTENLRSRQKLNVHLEAYDRLVGYGNSDGSVCGTRHTGIIKPNAEG